MKRTSSCIHLPMPPDPKLSFHSHQTGGQYVSDDVELGGPWVCPTPAQYSNGSCDPCGDNRPDPYWGARATCSTWHERRQDCARTCRINIAPMQTNSAAYIRVYVSHPKRHATICFVGTLVFDCCTGNFNHLGCRGVNVTPDSASLHLSAMLEVQAM